MLEDAVRKKSERKTKAQKKEEVLSSSSSPQVFDYGSYGQLVETEKIKVNFCLGCLFISFNFSLFSNLFSQVELFKELVTGFRTPITTPQPLPVPASTLSEDNKLKGYIHVAESADFSEEVRSRARLAMMKMLQLADDFAI